MSRLRRIRPALYVFAVAVAIGSLVGAKALTGQGDSPKSEAPPASSKGSGPVVLGTVDSDDPPIGYLLPPILQQGTVSEVFVKNGQEIKEAGEKLYAFDATIQLKDLEQAQLTVKLAQTKVDEAKEALKQHALKVEIAEEGVTLIQTKVDVAAAKYRLIKNNLETVYKAEGYLESSWNDRLLNEPKAFEAKAEWNLANGDLGHKKAELKALKEANVNLLVKAAEVGVDQANAAVAKAKTAVDLCTIRAKMPGTIEQITISPGSTLGVGTRTHAMWLIPSGARVVRAEIEAEFAHKITPSLLGKAVIIYDNSDPKMTYHGKVRRIGKTFLPKRSSDNPLLGNETRVLEAEIEVLEANPADRPPLRVGQRVRVDLGQ